MSKDSTIRTRWRVSEATTKLATREVFGALGTPAEEYQQLTVTLKPDDGDGENRVLWTGPCPGVIELRYMDTAPAIDTFQIGRIVFVDFVPGDLPTLAAPSAAVIA